MNMMTVTVSLDPELAKWVEALKEQTNMSEDEVIVSALKVLRLATSTNLGKIYLGFALKAAGLDVSPSFTLYYNLNPMVWN